MFQLMFGYVALDNRPKYLYKVYFDIDAVCIRECGCDICILIWLSVCSFDLN